MTLWERIWQSQGYRCGECGEAVEIEDTAKKLLSLKFVCNACYFKPNCEVIVDEFVNT